MAITWQMKHMLHDFKESFTMEDLQDLEKAQALISFVSVRHMKQEISDGIMHKLPGKISQPQPTAVVTVKQEPTSLDLNTSGHDAFAKSRYHSECTIEAETTPPTSRSDSPNSEQPPCITPSGCIPQLGASLGSHELANSMADSSMGSMDFLQGFEFFNETRKQEPAFTQSDFGGVPNNSIATGYEKLPENDQGANKRKRDDPELAMLAPFLERLVTGPEHANLIPSGISLDKDDYSPRMDKPEDLDVDIDAEEGKHRIKSGDLANETKEEKQERIRRRNREHARRCRVRKRQATDNLTARVKQLEKEYAMLMKAFRVLYNQKAMMETMVVSEFGSKGTLIVERTNTVTVMAERCTVSELRDDILSGGVEGSC